MTKIIKPGDIKIRLGNENQEPMVVYILQHSENLGSWVCERINTEEIVFSKEDSLIDLDYREYGRLLLEWKIEKQDYIKNRLIERLENHNIKTADLALNYNLSPNNDFTWTSIYSDDENPDKHGRWSRVCYYKGKRICYVNRVDHVDYGRYFNIEDFYPSSDSNICNLISTERTKDFETIKKEAEERFMEFLKDIGHGG